MPVLLLVTCDKPLVAAASVLCYVRSRVLLQLPCVGLLSRTQPVLLLVTCDKPLMAAASVLCYVRSRVLLLLPCVVRLSRTQPVLLLVTCDKRIMAAASVLCYVRSRESAAATPMCCTAEPHTASAAASDL
ncbi:hypothetical protein NDU88_001146 [Pleurodeles waltl]|uniref:Secreted protein n=1 Tax=Pleurodeles waltl TaxID=8319 RepID=A0AAV7V6Z9_PLEWA|nr:hypothetical protein NDU88_001146 [Pleurodeles waltl]